MRVSILIANYNYGRFVADAIDSALAQTHTDCEVVVVDDGSTDGSRDVIAAYGDRIVTVFKENGGHGSAFNAAFDACTGDVMCLLDSDDVFTEQKVEAVVEAFAAHPDAALVYHQLQHVDAELRPLGRPWPRRMAGGWLADAIVRSGGWWPRAGTCAISLPRAFMERVMPMPEDYYVQSADSYLVGIAPFAGRVVALKRPLALYRMHGQNDSQRSDRAHQLAYKLHRVKTDVEGVKTGLATRLGIETPISLEDNFRYHHLRWELGEERTPLKSVKTLLRTRSMPAPMKAEFLVRLALRRW